MRRVARNLIVGISADVGEDEQPRVLRRGKRQAGQRDKRRKQSESSYKKSHVGRVRGISCHHRETSDWKVSRNHVIGRSLVGLLRIIVQTPVDGNVRGAARNPAEIRHATG